MQFTLNGLAKTFDGDAHLSLLKYLRDCAGITSAKDGCSAQAACGCCTVELNHQAVLACVTPMKKVEGGQIVTMEGIEPGRRETLVNAFVEKGAVQCGFCTPGILMRAKVLLDGNPSPNREEVVKALQFHLCRCTGYAKIIDAILYAAQALQHNHPIPLPAPNAQVGSRHPRYGAWKMAMGEHLYVRDMTVAAMLYGALKFSDHPRAKILEIDISQAAKLPSVRRVFLAKDIPGERQTGLIVADWPVMVAVGEETRYIGDVLAGVVADTETAARQAVQAILVKYDVLPPITDVWTAMQADAPKLHRSGNVLSHTVVRRGDAAQALAQSAYVSEGVYETQLVDHAFLEAETCVARPSPAGGIEVFSQGQGPYEDRQSIAKILGLPLSQVRVVQIPTGGGFGGKEDLSVQGHAALFAHILKAPVKITLTRDESCCVHPKRHPLYMKYKLGCDQQGKLTALWAEIVGDTGAYASVGMKVLERSAGHATGAYTVPVVDIVSKAVYTNNLPAGAMRGFGVPQVTFAIESCMDDLCTQGKFDRWQFRYDNALQEGAMTSTGQVLKDGVGVRACLLALKDHFHQAKHAGLACGLKNTGLGNGFPESCTAKIEIKSKSQVILHHGWTEMGAGVNTIAIQMLCQETGISSRLVDVCVDTDANAPAGMTTASRATFMLGKAIIAAGAKLKADLQTSCLDKLQGRIYEGEWKCDWTTKPGAKVAEVITHYAYGYAAQLVVLDDRGKIATVYAAHDAGKIINPTLFEGQIEGAVHMGLGYALSEKLVLDKGIPKTTRLRELGILRARDMPQIVVLGVEVPDSAGPYGAKGVGEIGMVPTAAAVANALCHFDQMRRYKLPILQK